MRKTPITSGTAGPCVKIPVSPEQTSLTNRMIRILDKGKNPAQALQQAADALAQVFRPSGSAFARLLYDDQLFQSRRFDETEVVVKRRLLLPDSQQVFVELYLSEGLIARGAETVIGEAEQVLDVTVPLLKALISGFQLEKLTFEINERKKELKSLNQANEVLKKSMPVDELLQEVCSSLPEAMQFPRRAVARIKYGAKSFKSAMFKETSCLLAQAFDTPDGIKGSIEIFYLKSFPDGTDPFLKEERSLVANLASLIAGTVSKKALQELLVQNNERLKELKGINQTSEILKKSKSLEESLQSICSILPASWQYPEATVARISYNGKIFKSPGFEETPWTMSQSFEAPGKKKGTIEIGYLRPFPPADEGPFLKEERDLLVNLASLIAGSATREVFNKLNHENTERLKELKAINQTSKIIEAGKAIDDTLMEICSILPKSWQYPRYTVARIRFEGRVYTSHGFIETSWGQTENFVTIDSKKGTIDIFYLKQFPQEDEGPFLFEERNLLVNIARLISGYLNNYKGREIIHRKGVPAQEIYPSDEFRNSLIKTNKPLQLYFNQQAIDKYIYLDMMKYKVKHILFVATLYEAFILESEDSFFEKFMGEIYQYGLFSVPRITGVSSSEEAFDLLETTRFDLVILMAGMDREATVKLSEQIRAKKESLPIYLLLNKKSDIRYFEELEPTIPSIDKLFVWNGDSLILFAIVKSTEDKINVENDTRIGLVRVILLIEDSPLYYSRYLQFLYDIVFGQVQRLLPEVEKNELDKICKMRSRPKILLARNYEEAIAVFNKYKDFMLCVISDVEFDRAGKMDKKAGVRFIRYVKSHMSNLPIILQSSENSNERLAADLEVAFINKNSETLLNDLKHYLSSYLGFGNFIFRDREGNKIAEARSLREFETLLKEVPDESLYLHASENQFSLWLMARGEIQLARTLNPVPVSSFKNMDESRRFFLDTFRQYREEKKKGKILSFDETSTLDEKNIVSFSGGSLGGKGRGLAFIDTLIYNLDFPSLVKGINIYTPITVVIGSDEFQRFITKNNLFEKIIDPDISYAELRHHFAEAHLSTSLMRKLKVFVSQIDKPIAVRSSSSSEDSITQPFAGVFDTYLIPNSLTNKRVVLDRVSIAIKLVFASTFSDKARNFFAVLRHKIEEERMAVVLQELVGNQYGDYYYPHISGIAQSYNYYPVADMKPDEGFAVAAVGLGTYVVDGWKSFRFSPRYPRVSMYSVKDLLASSQVQFYALDCREREIDFLKDGELAALSLLDIGDAEKHGTLTHCASVYSANNDRLDPGLSSYGPRVVNFADILQYEYIPLARTISVLLNATKEAFGSPVEIEYAVDLNRAKNGLPTFYLLQIKPLIGDQIRDQIKFDKIDRDQMVLFTKSSVGNGRITDITDIIFIENEKFSKLKTQQMADEIEYLNNLMVRENRQYVLIGPGRWGSRDRFVGIPVNWSQISNAKVIVEVSLDNYPLDSSLGSHFFHNVTSMNIGYFSVKHSSPTDFVSWEMLNKQKVIHQTTFFKHVRFKKAVSILMDGKLKTSAILNGEYVEPDENMEQV